MEADLKRLGERLRQPLPGREAQYRMANEGRDSKFFQHSQPPRQSAVLLLLCPQQGQVHLPVILRPTYPGVHSGQMAFPGGKKDPQDEDLIATALRETHEEIGVSVERHQVLGTLSELFIPPSNMLVTPVLAYTAALPEFRPDLKEVERIYLPTVAHLSHPGTRAETSIEIAKGIRIRAPYYDVEGQVVWGATAMIISEFLAVWAE